MIGMILLIQWLENDCLSYFREWEESVKAMTDVDDKTKKKMLLSRETRMGIEMTSTI